MRTKSLKYLRAAALLLLCAVLCAPVCACGKSSVPSLDEVKDEFTALIEASAEINDIFFGPGLPVYDRETSSGDGNALYDEATKTYYWLLDDDKLGTVIKVFDNETKTYFYLTDGKPADPAVELLDAGTEYTAADGSKHVFYRIRYDEGERYYVYDENSPVYYDYIRLDCAYQTVNSIKKAAGKVYSAKYLESVYGVIFDGFMTDDTVVYARYMEDSTIEDGTYFLKSNRFEPYFETQTTYDCSTMKIVKPSTATRVTVEIEGTGRYIDREKLEVVTGKVTKTLVFVYEDEEWRLDTPTY